MILRLQQRLVYLAETKGNIAKFDPMFQADHNVTLSFRQLFSAPTKSQPAFFIAIVILKYCLSFCILFPSK